MQHTENQIREILRHARGGDQYYFHPLFKSINYTEGIREMAILCNANWLLIQLLDYCKFLSKKEEFLVIKFFKKQGRDNCKVVYTDGNDNIVFTIMLEYTDFPLHNQFVNKKEKEAILFFFRNDVLYLSSEH